MGLKDGYGTGTEKMTGYTVTWVTMEYGQGKWMTSKRQSFVGYTRLGGI